MARIDWFDDSSDLPLIDDQMHKLQHFVDSMADGVIEKQELEKQQATLIAAMRDVQGELSDAQHAKVTRLLVERSAYNVMRLLHELQQARVQRFVSA